MCFFGALLAAADASSPRFLAEKLELVSREHAPSDRAAQIHRPLDRIWREGQRVERPEHAVLAREVGIGVDPDPPVIDPRLPLEDVVEPIERRGAACLVLEDPTARPSAWDTIRSW